MREEGACTGFDDAVLRAAGARFGGGGGGVVDEAQAALHSVGATGRACEWMRAREKAGKDDDDDDD